MARSRCVLNATVVLTVLSASTGCKEPADKRASSKGAAESGDAVPASTSGTTPATATPAASTTTDTSSTNTTTGTTTGTTTDPLPPTSVHKAAWDFDGDGRSDFAKFWKDGTDWSTDVHPSTGTSFGIARWATKQGYLADNMQWYTGDFNGDGKLDFAKFWPDDNQWTTDVHLSTGSNFQIARWANKQGAQSDSMHWLTGDFNGDGKTDFLSYWNDGGSMSTDVHLSTGASFAVARWATKQGGIIDGMSWFAADFNGDGKTDLAKFWNDRGLWSCDVHVSTGSGFVMQHWAQLQGAWVDAAQWTVGDFNGDGKADFAKWWNDNGTWTADVHLSTGTGFTMQRWATQQGAYVSSMHWVTGDFNGDGKTDYAAFWNDNGAWTTDVHLSTGAAFTMARWATQQGGYFDGLHWVTGDFDGDGKTDFASYWTDQGQWNSDVHLSTGASFGSARWATHEGGSIDSMQWSPFEWK